MGIQKMPPEIMQQIFQDACLERKDLLAISGSCKFLHGNVEPILYSSLPRSKLVMMGIDNLDQVDDPTTIPLLLRTLLEKPQLGRHFREVIFCDDVDYGVVQNGQYNWQSPSQNTLLLTKTHWQMIESILNEFISTSEALASFQTQNLPSQTTDRIVKQWLQLMTGDSPNFRFLSPLILLLLPNVEKLYITNYDHIDLSIYSVLTTISKKQRRTTSLVNDPYSLSKLQELFLEASGNDSLAINKTIPIFQLQSLKALTCNNLCTFGVISCDFSPLSHLHHLILLGCSVPFPELSKVLLNCTRLKTFKSTYHVGKKNSLLENLTSLVDSLQHLQDNLEHLTYIQHPVEKCPNTGMFPSLTRFRNIRCLQLNGDALLCSESSAYYPLNFSHLPACLEKIAIINPQQSQIQMVKLLTINLPLLTNTPKLKRFHIDLDSGRADDGTRRRVPMGGYVPPNESERSLLMVSNIYADHGICLSITHRIHDPKSTSDLTEPRDVYVCTIEGEDRWWQKTSFSLS